jgi:hypothetical protein
MMGIPSDNDRCGMQPAASCATGDERTMTLRIACRCACLTGLLIVLAGGTARADWAVSGFIGGAHTQDTSLRVVRPAESTNVVLTPVRYRSESLDSPIYYGYRGAFFPRSRWLGIEGELIHLKVVADTARNVQRRGTVAGRPTADIARVSSIVQDFSITHGVNLLLVNAVLRRRAHVDSAGNARWALTARFGAGASVPHPESTINGQHVEGYEWGAMSLQAAAGAEVHVIGPVSLAGEYKLTRSVQDVTVAEGTALTPLVTHHVAIGLAVRLGR